MIGYKIAKVDGIRVVVTLEIPDDAITNMSRKDIMNVYTAKHRTNKAKVVMIEDELGDEYTYATSFSYKQKSVDYVVNETIVIDDYDMDLDKVCSTGIHFFLTRRCAELYNLYSIANGVYESWYDNGQKEMECTFVNGKRHGLYQQWYDNGKLFEESTYVDGKYHGLVQQWNYIGHKVHECTYVDGVLHGKYYRWKDNGDPYFSVMFENGTELPNKNGF